jgi:hypothetical protein
VGCLLLFHRHREEKDVIRRERQVRSRWKRVGYAKGHGSVGCDGKCTSDDGSISRRRVKRGRGGMLRSVETSLERYLSAGKGSCAKKVEEAKDRPEGKG